MFEKLAEKCSRFCLKHGFYRLYSFFEKVEVYYMQKSLRTLSYEVEQLKSLSYE